MGWGHTRTRTHAAPRARRLGRCDDERGGRVVEDLEAARLVVGAQGPDEAGLGGEGADAGKVVHQLLLAHHLVLRDVAGREKGRDAGEIEVPAAVQEAPRRGTRADLWSETLLP